MVTFGYDPKTEWKYGQDLLATALRSNLTTSDLKHNQMLKPGCNEALARRYLIVYDLPRVDTEAESKRTWDAVLKSYRKLRPFFTESFLEACRSEAIESNSGIAFYSQAKLLFRDVGYPSRAH